MKEIISKIKNQSLFSGVKENEITAMLSCLDGKRNTYKKGSYLLREGDTTTRLGLLLSGSVFVVQEDFWGNQNILSSLEEGDCFGETFACAPGSSVNVSVIAQTSVEVLYLDIGKILTVCPSSCTHHNQMIQNLVALLANKNLNFNNKITHLGQRTTRDKLLSYLSSEAKRQYSDTFDIPFTRQQLADYLSVDRSGLSVELGKMRSEGLLEFWKNHFRLKQ